MHTEVAIFAIFNVLIQAAKVCDDCFSGGQSQNLTKSTDGLGSEVSVKVINRVLIKQVVPEEFEDASLVLFQLGIRVVCFPTHSQH